VTLLDGEFAGPDSITRAEPLGWSDQIVNRVMVGKYADSNSVLTWLVPV
jgi:hypothetical protein